MSDVQKQSQQKECPVCGMGYDHRLRHAKDSNWKVRKDVAVCSLPQNDERVVYIHYDVKPVKSVSKTVREEKTKSLIGQLFSNS